MNSFIAINTVIIFYILFAKKKKLGKKNKNKNFKSIQKGTYQGYK